MMFKVFVPALLLFAGVPAAAQQAPADGPEAALRSAAMAFGQCVSAGVQGLASTVTAEAGATRVLAGCAAERTRVEQTAEALIATAPEAQQATAREQLRSQMARAETQIAAAIRQHRAAAPSAPAEQ